MKNCFTCGSSVVPKKCEGKLGWNWFLCINCLTKVFCNDDALAQYQVEPSEKPREQSIIEAQNFEALNLNGATDCPCCKGSKFKYRVSKKTVKTKKVGRPKKVLGSTLAMYCKECKFRAFVKKGFCKYALGEPE